MLQLVLMGVHCLFISFIEGTLRGISERVLSASE